MTISPAAAVLLTGGQVRSLQTQTLPASPYCLYPEKACQPPGVHGWDTEGLSHSAGSQMSV